MKKLNDLKCPQCGEVEKDVFTETCDGREVVKGSDGEAVTAVCNQCGAELRKLLPHLNIGGKVSESKDSDCTGGEEDSGIGGFAKSLIGKRLPTLTNPVTGHTLTSIVQSARVVQAGPIQAIDISCKAELGVMPNKLN